MRSAPILLGLLLSVAACGRRGADSPPSLDATRSPALPCARLLPYSPALAKIISQLGLWERVVGVTRWTEIPQGQSRPVVGDLLSVESERVLGVRPDCILTQLTEADAFRGVLAVAPETRIESFALERLDDVRRAALRIGVLTRTEEHVGHLVAAFDARLRALELRASDRPRPRVLLAVAMEHLLIAGRGSYMADVIEAAGGVNAGSDVAGTTSWPEGDHESVIAARPDVLIHVVSSPAEQARATAYWKTWPMLSAGRNGAVFVLSDPSWMIPSLDLVDTVERLFEMLHRPAASSPSVNASRRP